MGQEDPVEKEMANYSSIRTWRMHGQGSLAGYVHGVAVSDTTDVTWLAHMHHMPCRVLSHVEIDSLPGRVLSHIEIASHGWTDETKG